MRRYQPEIVGKALGNGAGGDAPEALRRRRTPEAHPSRRRGFGAPQGNGECFILTAYCSKTLVELLNKARA